MYFQKLFRKTCTSTNVGDICVLEHPKEKFNRVQIRRIRWDRNVSKDIIFVDLKCVDTGVIYEHINVRLLLYNIHVYVQIVFITYLQIL